MDFFVVGTVFRFPHARYARTDLHESVHKTVACLNQVFNRFVAQTEDAQDGFFAELASFFGDNVRNVFVALCSRVRMNVGDTIAVIVPLKN